MILMVKPTLFFFIFNLIKIKIVNLCKKTFTLINDVKDDDGIGSSVFCEFETFDGD